MVRFGRHMAGEIVDVIQRQPSNNVGPSRRCATKAHFHLVVDERPLENQVSLLRRQPDLHELSRIDPLAPHHISSCTYYPDSALAPLHGRVAFVYARDGIGGGQHHRLRRSTASAGAMMGIPSN